MAPGADSAIAPSKVLDAVPVSIGLLATELMPVATRLKALSVRALSVFHP